ncbi:MAG: sensor histidine kinase [Firmicutes bacterium]|nr:sensor histidine kinase [Bacillota bacterium]
MALSARFSIGITRPIKKLEKMMKEAAAGDLEGNLPVERNDEIGRLTMRFNWMLKRIQTLIEDVYHSRLNELEAELKALQAQINPHFLFNTLNIINSLAIISGVDSISQVITDLRDFFRYTMITEQTTVTLGEEIEQVKRYMAIQRLRFGERIEFEIDVPTELWGQPIVKLILQPLVENACLHGLEPNSGHIWKITIKARSTEEFLLLEVADNGVGINRETLAEIQAVLEGKIAPPERYIGLRNVHERIRLRYGNAFGLRLESVEGQGTVVTLRLPVKGKMDRLSGNNDTRAHDWGGEK